MAQLPPIEVGADHVKVHNDERSVLNQFNSSLAFVAQAVSDTEASAASAQTYAAQAQQSVADAAVASRLTPGTATTGAPGSAFVFTIDGDPGSQTISMTVPAGAKGDPGPAGSGNVDTVNGISGPNIVLEPTDIGSYGVVPLAEDQKIAALYLPSYVDDVLEYATLSAFPSTGEVGKIYVSDATGKIYRWSGSAYIEISPSPGSTDSVVEGSTNLYFTNSRAQAALTTALSGKVDKPISGDAAGTVPTKQSDGSVSWKAPAVGSNGPLERVSYLPSTFSSITVATSVPYAVSSSNLAVTFVVPASGSVRVRLSATWYNVSSTKPYYWSLLDGSSNVVGSDRLVSSLVFSGGAGTSQLYAHSVFDIPISGLTPGQSVTYTWAHRGINGSSGLLVGGTEFGAVAQPSPANYGPAIMEVYAE